MLVRFYKTALSCSLFSVRIIKNVLLLYQIKKTDGLLKEWLWETLETLGTEELKNFKWCLQNVTESRDGFKPIKKSRLENADRLDTVDLMVQMYDTKTAAVTKKILKKIKRNEGLLFRGNIKAVPVVLNNNENESIIGFQQDNHFPKFCCRINQLMPQVCVHYGIKSYYAKTDNITVIYVIKKGGDEIADLI